MPKARTRSRTRARDLLPGGDPEWVLRFEKSRSDSDMGINEFETEDLAMTLVCAPGRQLPARRAARQGEGAMTIRYAYLHGFASSSQSSKGQALRRHPTGSPRPAVLTLQLDSTSGLR